MSSLGENLLATNRSLVKISAGKPAYKHLNNTRRKFTFVKSLLEKPVGKNVWLTQTKRLIV